jgi:outer membrane protein OmpA-like peptidoglycan-associated protein
MRILISLSLLFFSVATFANIIGSDLQSFNPTSDGLDFVTVQSARTLPAGQFVIGGFLDYGWNTLPTAEDQFLNKFSTTNRAFSSDVHGAIGLLPDWEIGFNVSSLLADSIDNQTLVNYYDHSGLLILRANTKYRIGGDKTYGWAVNLSGDLPEIQRDPIYGNGKGSGYAAELIQTSAFGHFLLSLNGGFHWRQPSPRLFPEIYDVVGNEWMASAAASYRFEQTHWTAIGELWAAGPTGGTQYFNQSDLTNFEALLGAKYLGFKNISVHGGATAKFDRGTSSPDFRVYAGINWFPGSLWGKENHTPVEDHPMLQPAAQEELGADPMLADTTPEPDPVPVSSTATDTTVFDKTPTKLVERFVVHEINFATGSAVVPQSFYPYLGKFAEYLGKGKKVKRVSVYGYTDSKGGAILNQKLSQRRAESVRKILISKFHVPAASIEAIGMGAANPVASNATAEGRSQNRRVELKVERVR